MAYHSPRGIPASVRAFTSTVALGTAVQRIRNLARFGAISFSGAVPSPNVAAHVIKRAATRETAVQVAVLTQVRVDVAPSSVSRVNAGLKTPQDVAADLAFVLSRVLVLRCNPFNQPSP